MAYQRLSYIGLGSNLGDRKGFIKNALKMLSETEELKVLRVSDIIETAALGQANQPDYLNAIAEIETTLNATDLHNRLLYIETVLGRTRTEKWSSRTIDLDLLLFSDKVINSPRLTVPHPQMHLRSFVLNGLCQLNAELLHPVIKESMDKLKSRLAGVDFTFRADTPQLVSIAGIIGVGKTTLTRKLTKLLTSKPLFEDYKTNPFLPDVYVGRKELSLDSQLYFLAHRKKQLNRSLLKPGRIFFSDYIFDKELIYAKRLLDKRQLALYKSIYQPFNAEITPPVLVIYLQDSAQKCLQRIHKRNRPYEQKIEQEFLEALSRDYEQLLDHWKTSPVIRISMSELNNVGINHLAEQIKSYISI